MIEDQLFTIAEAAREAGIARSTLQRWIARKLLRKQPGGAVKWRDVQRCLKRDRTGRPHGLPAEAKANHLSESQQTLALPFLQGRNGLHRPKVLLEAIENYHVEAGRGKWMSDILLNTCERMHKRKSPTRSEPGKNNH